MKIAIVGGCFTCQHNIPFNRLYHQTLVDLLSGQGIEAEVQSIRYERLAKTIEKIEALRNGYGFNILLFHLRAEPLMRMVKFYYKYLDENGKMHRSLNIPIFRLFYPEKFDVLLSRRLQTDTVSSKESKMHIWLKGINYRFGNFIGNQRHAIKMHNNFLITLQEYCHCHKINLLVLGPVSRPCSAFENHLSKRMDKEFAMFCKKRGMRYVNLLGEITSTRENMFFENGIHVSQAGHDEVAKILRDRILEIRRE